MEDIIPQYPQLKGFEAHFNWIDGEQGKGIIKLTRKTIRMILTKLQADIEEQENKEDKKNLEFLPIKLLSLRLTSAFFYTLLDDFFNAQNFLDKVTEKISVYLSDPQFDDSFKQYFKGISHVHQGLEAFNQLARGDNPPPPSIDDEFLGSQKCLVGALSVKREFMCVARDQNDGDGQLELLKQMIDLDPSCYMWHLYLYRQLRFCRRNVNKNSSFFYNTKPSEEEMKALVQVLKLTDNKVNILAKELVCLAEAMTLLKDGYDVQRWPVIYENRRQELEKIGEVTLQDNIISFISSQIENEIQFVLEYQPESTGIWTDLGELYGDILPNEYKNYQQARICIDRSLELSPRSSKVHHRMAKYIWRDESENLSKDMFHHLETAVDLDPRNVGATMMLLKAYLSDPSKYKDSIRGIRDRLETLYWTLSEEASCHFILGCFYLLSSERDKKKETKAVRQWITATRKDPSGKTIQFKSMYKQGQNFAWPDFKQKLNSINVGRVIMSYAEECQDRSLLILREQLKIYQRHCNSLSKGRSQK